MRKFVTGAAVAAVLAITTLTGAGVAEAAIGIGFNIGDVSLGYSDGYWDRGHHWHRWAHRDDAARFRAEHGDMYHEWRHDDRHHHD